MVSLTTKGLFAEPYRSLSVGVSTLGRYIGIPFTLGKGAPPIMQLSEKQKFAVTVDKVYFRNVKKTDKGLKILVKNITIGDY